MMRCRPGIVRNTAFATVPDQRRTASLPLALHRIRDTRSLDPRVHRVFAITLSRLCQVPFAKGMDARVKPAHDNLMKSAQVENALVWGM
jgi:hypothetical protein